MDIKAKVPVKKVVGNPIVNKLSLDIAQKLKEKQNQLNEMQRQRIDDFSRNNDSMSSYFAFLSMLKDYNHKLYTSQIEKDVENFGVKKDILDQFVNIYQEREQIIDEMGKNGADTSSINFASIDELFENSDIKELLESSKKITKDTLVSLSDKLLELSDHMPIGKGREILSMLNNEQDINSATDEISYEMR